MLARLILGAVALALLGWLSASSAHAHFVLDEPMSYVDQTGIGAPQKGAPCGPGSSDDVQPLPASDAITEVQAGSKLMVRWHVTVPHPGHLRIALAEDPADFEEPTFIDPVECSYEIASVPTGAHGNVLMDGIPASRTMQEVTLPDEPCEKCTLQVIQVMKDHGPP